jgi:hypothetical protein
MCAGPVRLKFLYLGKQTVPLGGSRSPKPLARGPVQSARAPPNQELCKGLDTSGYPTCGDKEESKQNSHPCTNRKGCGTQNRLSPLRLAHPRLVKNRAVPRSHALS